MVTDGRLAVGHFILILIGYEYERRSKCFNMDDWMSWMCPVRVAEVKSFKTCVIVVCLVRIT
jgi:hypothetical protein